MVSFEINKFWTIHELCSEPSTEYKFIVDTLITVQEMRNVEFMGRNLFVQLSKDTPDRKREDGRAKRQKRDHFESRVSKSE